MSVAVTPHLNFRDQARRALEFYQSAFGGEITVVTYGAMGAAQRPEDAERVMWGQVAGESGFRVMAFDVLEPRPFEQGQNAYFVSVRFSAEEEAQRCWTKLAEGATVRQELGPSAWSPLYGMLADQFGVVWIVDVAAAGAA